MSSLQIQLLGGLRAKLHGSELQFPTKKSEALLAFLSSPPGRTHPREKLAAMFWGDSGEEQARQSLRQTLFTLRKLVNVDEEIVVTGDSDRLGLDSNRVSVDVVAFEKLLEEGGDSLTKAVELYHGEFLDGLTVNEEGFESWVGLERERLRERALSALSSLLEQQTEDRQFDSAVQTAIRILALDPLRESTHRALMRLYVQQGRREAALKQYHTCADALRRQLQVEPEEETRHLFDEIRAVSGGAKKGTFERTRILLVEDNLLNRQLVISMLDDKKYEIVIAEDGAQALLHLGNRPFDLILLDIKLPNIDGLTLLKVIRENGYHTPTILMTAMPGSEPEIKGLRLGAADFVRKPLQKSVLVARIQKALGESQ